MTVQLLAFHELAQAKARYCRLLDCKDWVGLSELLSEDIEFDLSDGNPDVPPITGRENVLNAVQSSVAGAKTVHQVHAPEFDLHGDDAWVVWAVQERVVWDNGTSLTAFGRYHDHWIRHGGQWKISALRLTHQIMDFS
ncbi:nuclear transport factor 2 family protein [Mycobacterium paraterrae]|uniref:Nuclear transport factor 2 family protein n=1 Tax=Mycobacterium paraterrae TaxID=577492 RepID=A0ABY3VQD9_9MYCO|nr:nuclear transport factor 2 family protein [Mycobacterium paraterrae]UMB69709.1 nuclear transport factor 2 family protein [Mycobacterium paraterrae]